MCVLAHWEWRTFGKDETPANVVAAQNCHCLVCVEWLMKLLLHMHKVLLVLRSICISAGKHRFLDVISTCLKGELQSVFHFLHFPEVRVNGKSGTEESWVCLVSLQVQKPATGRIPCVGVAHSSELVV